jgi:hypothetical protein
MVDNTLNLELYSKMKLVTKPSCFGNMPSYWDVGCHYCHFRKECEKKWEENEEEYRYWYHIP